MIEPIWVNEADALRTHDFVLTLNGGAPGVRDHNLLLSALARPRQHFAYATSLAIIDMAAALAAGEINEQQYAQFLRDTTTPSTPAQSPPPGA